MKAKDFLKQLKKLDVMISNKEIEVLQWKSIAEGTTAQMGGERVQSSGSQQKMADAVVMYTDIINETIAIHKTLVETKKDVIAVIEKLDVIEYDILHKHYVQYIELADIAIMYDKSYSWITTKHGRALQKIQEILDGRGGK